MDLGLAGRVAFVAASSRGLGLATAMSFARESADVGMCARDGGALDEAAAQVRALGVRVQALPADVSVPEQAAGAVESAVSELGRLDCLVVNAGGPPPGRFVELGDEQWRRAYDLTLMSAVHLVRAALPTLRQSDAASIVFISSTSVRQPIDGLLLSNSLRGAVAGLAKTMARELAPHVRVNTVLPGRILTDRTRQLAVVRAHGGQSVEEVIAEESASIPLRRYGDPEELGRVAVFLSSPAAAYVTGATVAVDGGLIGAI